MTATTVSFVDTLSLLLLATGFAVAGTRRMSLAIWTLAVQSGLLAAVAAVVAVGAGAAHMWAVVVLTVAVKAVAIPAVLFRVLRTLEVRRETNPLVSSRLSLVAAAGLMVVAFGVAGQNTLPNAIASHEALPVSIALMLISLFTMVTRKKALMQVIALVSMDNGLYLAGIIATLGLPLFVEIALFFDLLVGVIIMGVFAFRINQTFETVNTDRLRQLRG